MPKSEERSKEREDPPSGHTILDRALTFALEGLQAADVRLRRARQEPSSDPGGAFLWWIDLQFFIVAMRRLRRAAELALKVPAQHRAMKEAIESFDQAVPGLQLLRNVGEHIDDYALGSGFDSSVRWRQLQVGGWDGVTVRWLDVDLNVEEATTAGREAGGGNRMGTGSRDAGGRTRTDRALNRNAAHVWSRAGWQSSRRIRQSRH